MKDPREALRPTEGTHIGIYDLTVMPLEALEEAARTGGLTIPGQPGIHSVSRASAEKVLHTKRSHLQPVAAGVLE